MTETIPQQEENPLLEGLLVRRTPDPCAFVIVGAFGDLTQRKLIPALYSLAYRRLLPEKFAVVGVARSEETDDEFRSRMENAVREHARDPFRQEVWDFLASGMRYVATDFADEEGEDRIAQVLTELDEERGTAGNRLYYFAVPPSAIGTLVKELGGRRSAEGWVRLIIEKPFGRDLPHRPLPRQGNRPEHAGAAVRERHLRADLEPPVHRPRADHGRRVDRDRRARRLLRAGGRDPRHLPEPPLAAARADGDGAADRLHGRLGAERESEGAAGAAY